jgi:hypothetical protein
VTLAAFVQEVLRSFAVTQKDEVQCYATPCLSADDGLALLK